MHRAGIAWPEAVRTVVGADPRFAETMHKLGTGGSISDAFRDVVDPLDAALIAAGERDGSLERTFDEMAVAHESRTRERRERTTRQLYPLVLGHVAAFMMAAPNLLQRDITGALFWAVLILVPIWAWILIGRRIDRLSRPGIETGPPHRPLPPLGPLLSRTEEADARALEALGRLYDAGVPIGDAVALAQRAGWGGRVALDLEDAKARIGRGEDLAPAFTHTPPEIVRQVAAGEQTGSLGHALLHAADDLRFGVGTRRKRTAQVLPIVLMLIVGGIIAIRLFAFYGGYFARLKGL